MGWGMSESPMDSLIPLSSGKEMQCCISFTRWPFWFWPLVAPSGGLANAHHPHVAQGLGERSGLPKDGNHDCEKQAQLWL